MVIPLAMVGIDELRKHPSKVALAERYYPIEALVFDRPHEAFGVRVRIWRLKRRLHDVHPGVVQQLSHVLAPFSGTIVDQYAMIAEWAVSYGQRAADLAHEQIIGMRCRRHDLTRRDARSMANTV